jgi:hypothetical protein
MYYAPVCPYMQVGKTLLTLLQNISRQKDLVLEKLKYRIVYGFSIVTVG